MVSSLNFQGLMRLAQGHNTVPPKAQQHEYSLCLQVFNILSTTTQIRSGNKLGEGLEQNSRTRDRKIGPREKWESHKYIYTEEANNSVNNMGKNISKN